MMGNKTQRSKGGRKGNKGCAHDEDAFYTFPWARVYIVNLRNSRRKGIYSSRLQWEKSSSHAYAMKFERNGSWKVRQVLIVWGGVWVAVGGWHHF